MISNSNNDATTLPNQLGEEERTKLKNADVDEKVPLEEEKKADKKWTINKACLLKYISLLVLVLQNTSQVLVMRHATTRVDHPPFLKTVAVFFNEVVKFVAALALFFASTGDIKKSFSLLHHHFITNFFDTLKVGVPAFIYVIQNFLLYVAVENLDAGTYMVTYQLKILTTAMFTVLMLKRKLSIQQWAALIILIAGVAIVQISANQKSASSPATSMNATNQSTLLATTSIPIPTTTQAPYQPDERNEQSPLLGFTTIIVACFLSGFAGIYFEKILKGSDVSVWLRNTQLAALSMPIGLVVIAIKDGQRVHQKGFMQGFDMVVWIVVLLQALGGLVVAIVIKYADNILKAFATSVSIVVATIASIFIFYIYPKPLFIGGAVLVIAAVVLYGTFPYKRRRLVETDPEEEDGDKGQELQVIVHKPPVAEPEEKPEDGQQVQAAHLENAEGKEEEIGKN